MKTLDIRELDTVHAWQNAAFSVTLKIKNGSFGFWARSEEHANEIRSIVKELPFLFETHWKVVKVDARSFVSLDFSPLGLPK
jgi:hypothetical protein